MNVKKIKSTREKSGGLYPLDVGSAVPGPRASGRSLCALLADQLQQGMRW